MFEDLKSYLVADKCSDFDFVHHVLLVVSLGFLHDVRLTVFIRPVHNASILHRILSLFFLYFKESSSVLLRENLVLENIL